MHDDAIGAITHYYFLIYTRRRLLMRATIYLGIIIRKAMQNACAYILELLFIAARRHYYILRLRAAAFMPLSLAIYMQRQVTRHYIAYAPGRESPRC